MSQGPNNPKYFMIFLVLCLLYERNAAQTGFLKITHSVFKGNTETYMFHTLHTVLALKLLEVIYTVLLY